MSAKPTFCANCGAQIRPGAKFCAACGTPVATVAQTETPASPPAAKPAAAPERKGMGGTLALVGGGILLAVVAAGLILFRDPGDAPSPPQTAQTPETDVRTAEAGQRWETYVNTRYGVVVDYPADLFTTMEDEPPDHSGRGFSGAGNTWFFVYSSANALGQTHEEMLADTAPDESYEQIVSSNLRADGFDVIMRREGEIVRQHLLTSEDGGFLHWLQIGWPQTREDELSPLAERMIASFRVDPSIPEAAANAATDSDIPNVPVDALSSRMISSADYGFAVEGAPGAGFRVGIPDYWIREEATGVPHELVFRSPDEDLDAVGYLAFVGHSAGRTPEEIASAQTQILQEIGGSEILESGPVQTGAMPAYRILQTVGSPSDAGGNLMVEIIVIDAGNMLLSIELTAPEPIWHTMGEAMPNAIATLSFSG